MTNEATEGVKDLLNKGGDEEEEDEEEEEDLED